MTDATDGIVSTDPTDPDVPDEALAEHEEAQRLAFVEELLSKVGGARKIDPARWVRRVDDLKGSLAFVEFRDDPALRQNMLRVAAAAFAMGHATREGQAIRAARTESEDEHIVARWSARRAQDPRAKLATVDAAVAAELCIPQNRVERARLKADRRAKSAQSIMRTEALD